MSFYISFIIGIILDLYSKYVAAIYLRQPLYLIGDFFFLQYVENPGIAFSIHVPFLKILTIILIISIFVYYIRGEKQKKSMLVDTAFGLILAGAIGNGFERVYNSFVVDFIGIKGFSVFNIADSCITIGAILYILHLLQRQKK